jgi:hypothetical protein
MTLPFMVNASPVRWSAWFGDRLLPQLDYEPFF